MVLPLNDERMMREVYCPSCLVESKTDKAFPFCSDCKKPLIKFVRNALTGKRVEKTRGDYGIPKP